MEYPLVKAINYQHPDYIFSRFAEWDGVVFLDSAELRDHCGRYSFIAIDPFIRLMSKNGEIIGHGEKSLGNPFEVLASLLSKFNMKSHPDMPPFQGGVAGCFSYDLYQHLEKVPLHAKDDMGFPDLAIGFYDVVLAFDNLLKKAWIFSSGFPFEGLKRTEHALKRLQWLENKIQEPLPETKETIFNAEISADFTAENYQIAVQKVIDYILAGDIFEANISQRFKAVLSNNFSSFELYQQLRIKNPAPFAAYLRFGDMVLASASPERFLKLLDGNIETRPIKGTRPRGKSKEEDEKLAHDLMNSSKDHAENIMIVDLLRNDLSKVCENHSVKVPQLCSLESYASVHHLVSVVQGKLKPLFHAIDLLKACFPGGSITGAPKIRAMEIIAEIEPTSRGPYCGSIGYIGFDGTMDTSIVIRTFAIKNNSVTFQAGGAIVADSEPLDEYQEALTKANALRKLL